MQPTLTINDDPAYIIQHVCHHMPQGAELPELRHGMTLRQVLRALRAVNWGDIGGTYPLELSDGTFLEVTLEKRGDMKLMNSQRAHRYAYDSRALYGGCTIRYYAL